MAMDRTDDLFRYRLTPVVYDLKAADELKTVHERDMKTVNEWLIRIEGQIDKNAELPRFRQELASLRERIESLERSHKPQ